jgi:hypothetical protein
MRYIRPQETTNATDLGVSLRSKRVWTSGYLLSSVLLAAILSFLVIKTVAKIEDKYLETHRVFLDCIVYQKHLFDLWLASHHASRFQLAWNEIINPVDGGEIPPLAFRTIPIILLNPEWLKDPHAHLITSGFSLFVFLCLLLRTVYRRTGSFSYACAAAILTCTVPAIYDPMWGLGAFWLDFSAGFIGGAAALCLINARRGENGLAWLGGFAILAAATLLSRFVTGVYLLVQGAPILLIYFLDRWRKTRSFLNSVVVPIALISGILLFLTGPYIWGQTSSQMLYYTELSYDYKDVLSSAQFVLNTTLYFFGHDFLLFCFCIFLCQVLFAFRVRWRGLSETVWLAIAQGVFLTITCEITVAFHAMEYSLPILLFAFLCPIDWRPVAPERGDGRANEARPAQWHLALSLGLTVFACFSINRALHERLWNPPKPPPEEVDKKQFYDRATEELMRNYPDKTISAYFDLFDIYFFVIDFERFNHVPMQILDCIFDVRDTELKAHFPGKTPTELASAAYQQALQRSDIVLVFDDPATAFKETPFDYGANLNPYSEEIAFRMAAQLKSDPGWRKLFVLPSRYMVGGVAAYANLRLFPQAGFEGPLSR